jgi:hypothetical protein
VANDVNNDNAFCMKDFEDIFVRHLSTGDDSGYELFFEKPIPDPQPKRSDSLQVSQSAFDITNFKKADQPTFPTSS